MKTVEVSMELSRDFTEAETEGVIKIMDRHNCHLGGLSFYTTDGLANLVSCAVELYLYCMFACAITVKFVEEDMTP